MAEEDHGHPRCDHVPVDTEKSGSATGGAGTELVDSFITATIAQLDPAYQRLVDALWNEAEGPTALAAAAVPALVARLDQVDDDRSGHLAILLGLLAEAGRHGPAAEAAGAVRQGLDCYLQLWQRSEPGGPLSLALLYLLAHFPGDRGRILPVAAQQGLAVDDLSRLDRALQHLDPDHLVLGRVFPFPAAWTLDESERELDRAWVASLTPSKVRESWTKDTRTVLGHLGAKAYWAVRNRSPVTIVPGPVPHPPEAAPEAPAEPRADLFGRHAAALRCPRCGEPLRFRDDGVRCVASCGAPYPLTGGILDLSRSVPTDVGVNADLLMKLSETPRMGRFYESMARPAFLRLSGANWGGLVTPDDEREFVATHTRPVAGPVLDLAAGAGTWTAMLAEAVGGDRVIALDMARPMLTALRRRLPEVPAVRANAVELPLACASLGAVNCWNSLQAFPDGAATAIAEVGRCLRPGGSLTLMTFRRPPDPIYRHFVSCHHFPQHPEGLRLFDLDTLKGWLGKAGLAVRHEAYPGNFVLISAERTS
jgi:SAM-dependent methyltransferase